MDDWKQSAMVRSANVNGHVLMTAFPSTSLPPPKRVRVNGTELAYVERGRGQPVVLVHGSLVDYRSWKGQLAGLHLSRQFRVIAYSRRGHYPNSPEGWADITVHESDLAALIGALDLGPVHLVGHSFGGALALLLAADHPELVQTLVLADASMQAVAPETKAAAQEFAAGALAPAREAVARGELEAAAVAMLDWVLAPLTVRQLPPAARAAIRQNAGILKAMPAAPASRMPTGADAQTVRAPPLIITGEQSRSVFRLMAAEIAQNIKNAKLVVLPETSHALPLQSPHAFNKAVLRFLGEQT